MMPLALALLAALGTVDQPHEAHVAGTVRDGKGSPLPGVTVLVNRTSDAPLDGGAAGLPKDTTDADGRYSLPLRFTGDNPIRVQEVWADADGLVSAREFPGRALADGETLTLDLILRPGEPLAGTIKLPPTLDERRRGLAQAEGPFVVEVASVDFRQIHLVRPPGDFSLSVPSGTYAIRVLNAAGTPTFKGLKSGRRDLVLEPEPVEINAETLGLAFDRVWTAMDRSYSYFSLKPEVDWAALRDEYRPRALKVSDADEFAAVLVEMMAPLKDLHVWIETPKGRLGTFRGVYSYNGNGRVLRETMTDVVDCGFAVVGRTKDDGLGYFLMVDQSRADDAGVTKAIAAIEALRDAPGFVVDLRRANGGDERKAQRIARLFCAKPVVYARSKRRAGPEHDAFTPTFPRTLDASPDPITSPVVCLIGPGAVSSGEGFVKMMAALPQVTTVGLPTRGASGNPAPVELPELGIAVWFSRWVDLTPEGEPFEGVGLKPDVLVEAPPEAYRDADPTLERGLEILRERVGK